MAVVQFTIYELSELLLFLGKWNWSNNPEFNSKCNKKKSKEICPFFPVLNDFPSFLINTFFYRKVSDSSKYLNTKVKFESKYVFDDV